MLRVKGPPDYPGRPLAEYPQHDYGAEPPRPGDALLTREQVAHCVLRTPGATPQGVDPDDQLTEAEMDEKLAGQDRLLRHMAHEDRRAQLYEDLDRPMRMIPQVTEYGQITQETIYPRPKEALPPGQPGRGTLVYAPLTWQAPTKKDIPKEEFIAQAWLKEITYDDYSFDQNYKTIRANFHVDRFIGEANTPEMQAAIKAELTKTIQDMFSRGQFSDRYLYQNPTQVINIRKPKEKEMVTLVNKYGNTITNTLATTTATNTINFYTNDGTTAGTSATGGWRIYDPQDWTVQTTGATATQDYFQAKNLYFRVQPEEWTTGIVVDNTATYFRSEDFQPVFRDETPEQLAERNRLWTAQGEERHERERKHRQARQAAENRAEELLRQYLSEEQRFQLDKHNYFELRSSSGKIYRINRGTHGNVKLLDPKTRKPIKSFCIYPKDVNGKENGYRGVPVPDHMLSQKVMLEHMEDEFLKTANASNIRAVA